jgi:hypothetical protein
MTKQGKRALSFVVLLVALGGYRIGTSAQDSERSAPEQKSGGANESVGLRDVFLGKESAPAQFHRVIGRLGILLKTDEGVNRVRHDYLFRNGDRFRFEITANQGGWLYVLHTSPGGKVEQLWPRKQDSNEIRTEQTYEIPPRPGIFIFDKEVGDELFYVAIRSEQTPPTLGRPTPRAKPTDSKEKTAISDSRTPTTRITNFRIRDPFGGTPRGIIFDPGQDDTDPYLYFSAVPRDTTQSAMIEFQLRHVE